jgi:hypothetical protein
MVEQMRTMGVTDQDLYHLLDQGQAPLSIEWGLNWWM